MEFRTQDLSEMARWVRYKWPRIKKGRNRRLHIVFTGQTGFHLQRLVARTWIPEVPALSWSTAFDTGTFPASEQWQSLLSGTVPDCLRPFTPNPSKKRKCSSFCEISSRVFPAASSSSWTEPRRTAAGKCETSSPRAKGSSWSTSHRTVPSSIRPREHGGRSRRMNFRTTAPATLTSFCPNLPQSSKEYADGQVLYFRSSRNQAFVCEDADMQC
jgi:hypothetical protein